MTPDQVADALDRHEREDDGRFTKIMVELSAISTKLDGIEKSVRTLDARQWEEHPSRAKTPTGLTSAAATPLGTKAIAGLVVAVVTLAEIVASLARAALHG